MKQIKIITDEDSVDCNTCGATRASGGVVYIDGVEVLSLPAAAACYDGDDNSPEQLLIKALSLQGIEVIFA